MVCDLIIVIVYVCKLCFGNLYYMYYILVKFDIILYIVYN